MNLEGYDEFFDPPLESKYECPICLLGLREPVQTSCGHRFCKGCIVRSIRDAGPKCPVDNECLSESQLYPDNFAKREMMDQAVFCRMKKQRGCTWKGMLYKLQEHLIECDFVVVKCPKKCGKEMERKDLKEHMEKECPKRTTPCKHCKKAIKWNELEEQPTLFSRDFSLEPSFEVAATEFRYPSVEVEQRSEGYDEFFDPPLKSKYECPICLLGLREPVQTSCGHRFCKGCIVRSIRDAAPKCPVDNECLSESQLYPDNFAKHEMMDQAVFCRMKKQRGCTWKGKLGKLQEHLNECDFVNVKCPKKCEKEMERKDLKEHLEKECPNRTTPCKHCKKAIKWNELEDYYGNCPKFYVKCDSCKKENVAIEKGLRLDVVKRVAEETASHTMEMAKKLDELMASGSGSNNMWGQRNGSGTGRFRGGAEAFLRKQASQEGHLHDMSSRTHTQQDEIDELRRKVAEMSNLVHHLERRLEESRMSQERPIQELALSTFYGVDNSGWFYEARILQKVGENLHVEHALLSEGEWKSFKHLFFHPDGTLYAVHDDKFYKGPLPNSTLSVQGWIDTATVIGSGGWNTFQFLFFDPEGMLYGVANGKLYRRVPPTHISDSWLGTATLVGNGGWEVYQFLFFDHRGMLYGVENGKFHKRRPPTHAEDNWLESATLIGDGGWNHFQLLFFMNDDGLLYGVYEDNFYRHAPPDDARHGWLVSATLIRLSGLSVSKFLMAPLGRAG